MNMITNKVIAIDVEGLVSYPGFKELVDELEKSGNRVFFCSSGTKINVEPLMRNNGFGKYIDVGRCLTSAEDVCRYVKAGHYLSKPGDEDYEVVCQWLRDCCGIQSPTKEQVEDFTFRHTESSKKSVSGQLEKPYTLAGRDGILIESDGVFLGEEGTKGERNIMKNWKDRLSTSPEMHFVMVPEFSSGRSEDINRGIVRELRDRLFSSEPLMEGIQRINHPESSGNLPERKG